MSEIALASLNTFGKVSPKADFVPPAEQLITLTYSQLQDLVTQAVEKAIQPLQERISALEAKVASQAEEIVTLKVIEEQERTRIFLDIAHDRRRITCLEHPEKKPGKTELARVEKIERYLAARPDHKASFEMLKGHLGVNAVLLNQAIKVLLSENPGRFGMHRPQGDRRKRILVMLSK